jgi:hypothetical protein
MVACNLERNAYAAAYLKMAQRLGKSCLPLASAYTLLSTPIWNK